MSGWRCWLGVWLCVMALAGCSSRIDLYTGMSEQDANEVVSALLQAGVDGEKVTLPKHGFTVRVPENQLVTAMSHLYKMGLPRNTYQRMGDVFKKDGVVSTPIEERSRYLYALSQELENTLSQIDGVILARVHPVLPERLVPGEPAQPSSCSVLIKHRIEWDPAVYEDRIRRLVVSSIPGLSKAQRGAVSIVFVPSALMPEANGGQHATDNARVEVSVPWVQWLLVGALSLVIVTSAGLLMWQWVMEKRSNQASPLPVVSGDGD